MRVSLHSRIIQLDSIGAKRQVEVCMSTPDSLSQADSAPSPALPHRPMNRRPCPSPEPWYPFQFLRPPGVHPRRYRPESINFKQISCPSVRPSPSLSAGVGSGLRAPSATFKLNRCRRSPNVSGQDSKAQFGWSYNASLGNRPRGD